MLYIPYPFKRCVTCGNEYLPTTRYFLRRKDSTDGLRGECRRCHNAQTVEWNKNHRDQANARIDRYRTRHREEILIGRRAQYKLHQQELRDKRKHYYWLHQEEQKAARRNYGKTHRDKERANSKRWQKENLDRDRAKSQRRRTRKRALPVEFTVADWQRCLDYFKGCCAVCGRPPGLWHKIAQDHWIPLYKGGGYTPNNIVPLCHGVDGCNNSKHHRDPIEWLYEKFSPRKAKQILKRIDAYFAWVKLHVHD